MEESNNIPINLEIEKSNLDRNLIKYKQETNLDGSNLLGEKYKLEDKLKILAEILPLFCNKYLNQSIYFKGVANIDIDFVKAYFELIYYDYRTRLEIINAHLNKWYNSPI